MNDIAAVLRAAAGVAPLISPAAAAVEAAFSAKAAGTPPAADWVNKITSGLAAVATVAPALASLAPIVGKALKGEQVNDADLATLKAAADQIDAAVAEAEAAAVADAS